MVVVDIKVISKLRKSRPHGAILAWHAAHPLPKRLTAFMTREKSPDLLGHAMIAATALNLQFLRATRNTRDFETFRVRMINPFLFQKH